MKKYLIVMLLLFAILSAQTRLDKLKNDLESSSGIEKLEILTTLQEEYHQIHPQTSLKFGQQALQYANKINNNYHIALQKSNLAKTFKILEQYDKAISNFEISNNKALDANATQLIVDNLIEIVEIAIIREDLTAALKTANRALKISQTSSNKLGEAESNKMLGLINISAGKLANAYKFYNKAISYYKKSGDYKDLAEINYDIGYHLLLLNSPTDAEAFLHKATQLYKNISYEKGLLNCYESLSIVYKNLGQNKNFQNYLTLYYEISQKIENELEGEKYLFDYEYFTAIGDNSRAAAALKQHLHRNQPVEESEIEKISQDKNDEAKLKEIKEREAQELEKSLNSSSQETSQKIQQLRSEKKIINQQIQKMEAESKKKKEFFEKTFQEKAEKIQNLQLENQVKNLKLTKKTRQRNYLIIVAAVILLLLIVLINRYSLKKKMNYMLEERNIDLEHLTKLLKEKEQKLQKIASKDHLTKLPNRRSMLEKLEREKSRFERTGRACSLIMSDIDNFKNINDSYGHDYGDYVLKTISKSIQDNIRSHDVCARWGGEEFLFLIPETDEAGAGILAEKIRKIIDTTKFNFNETQTHVAMSFGVNEVKKGQSIDDCIKCADLALYHSKKTGKNKVTKASKLKGIK